MCRHCDKAEQDFNRITERAASGDDPYFSPDDHGDGWMDPEERAPDYALEMYGDLMDSIREWAGAKGQSFAHIEKSVVPMSAMLSIVRELQMRRAIDAMSEATDETFRL